MKFHNKCFQHHRQTDRQTHPHTHTQQKQHSSTDTVSPRFSRANGNNTVTPPSVQTVTVYSVVGTLYTDFKDGTVLFTVELRITDRPSQSLYRPRTVRAVLAPSKYRESLLHGVRQSSVHSGYQNGFRSCAIDLPHPKYEAIKIQLSKYNRQKYKKKEYYCKCSTKQQAECSGSANTDLLYE